MRKLILISAAAVLLASASAQAGEMLAAADAPAVTPADRVPQPLPPVTGNNDAKPQATETARPLPSKPRSQARGYSSDEAKARRIAARYGISW
jgi:hypothetical protein